MTGEIENSDSSVSEIIQIFRNANFDVDSNIYDSAEGGKKESEKKFFIYRDSGKISRHLSVTANFYAITENANFMNTTDYNNIKEVISISPTIALVGVWGEDNWTHVKFMDRKKRDELIRKK